MSEAGEARPQARRLIGMAGLSATGDGIARTLLPLAAAAAPHAEMLVGVVQTAARLPWLAASLPAGRAADGRGPSAVLAVGLALKLGGLLLIATAALTSTWWLLVPAALAAATGEVLFETATQVSVVHDFTESDRPKTNSALQATQVSLGQFVGPTVAGLFWQWNALVSLVSALSAQIGATAARRQWEARRSSVGLRSPAAGPRSGWGAGLRALWSTDALRATTLIGTVSMLAYGLWSVCFVLHVTGPTGLGASSAVFGLLVGCPAIGALLGSRAFPPLLPRLSALAGLLAMIVGQLGLFVPAALGAPAVVLAGGLVIYGLGLAGWSTGVLAFRQSVVPREVYGQATGAYRFVSWGASPLGAMLGGVLVTRAGASLGMLVGVALVVAQLPLVPWARSLRGYRGGPA